MRRKQILLILSFVLSSFFLILLNAQEDLPKAGRYKLLPGESKITIEAGTAGAFGFLGHGHAIAPASFSGELEFAPQNAIPATLSIQIDATSLHEIADFKPEDKSTIEKQLHGDVLETVKYPEITFRSTNIQYSVAPGRVFEARIEGDLALHGVTKKIMVPARITIDGANLRATGKFEINRKDYNIETKSAGGGTVKVDKTLKIDFLAVLQPQG